MSERVLWVGDMARDDAAVERLDAVVNVAGRHEHPGLIEKAQRNGGEYYPTDLENAREIGELAVATSSTLVVVTRDSSLACGAVDELRLARPDLKIVGPNKWLARLESSKAMSRLWTEQIDPSMNPLYREVTSQTGLSEAMDFFKSMDIGVAVKPINLAGGRGVRVMGKNLDSYEEACEYSRKILDQQNQEGVLLEEALEGVEFNMQIITDGTTFIAPPVTVDYSYRDDGDKGPPTGGMGSFAFAPGELPPFLTQADYEKAFKFSKALISLVQAEYDEEIGDGQHFSGVHYPNFIITRNGLKKIEDNVRPGDPEWMNIEQVIDPSVDMADVYTRMATQELRQQDVEFIEQASVVQYFVPADYARNSGDEIVEFRLDREAIARHEVDIYFSSAEKQGDHYKTIGSSRSVAFAAKGNKPWIARRMIMDAYLEGGPAELEFRNQVGQKEYINSLQDPRNR